MKLLSSEEDLRQISHFYSGVSFLILSCILTVLLLTNTYLLVGGRIIYPLFILLVVFEFCKWCFLVIVFKKDFTFNRKSAFISLYKSVNFLATVRTISMLFISCAGYYIVTLLYGAEVLDKKEGTLMFSILLTLLTEMPVSVQLGSSYLESILKGVRPKNTFQALLYNNCQGTLIGAWLGAFVIPLDWDREWQTWPVPCFLGALTGYILSNALYFILITLVKTRIIKKQILMC